MTSTSGYRYGGRSNLTAAPGAGLGHDIRIIEIDHQCREPFQAIERHVRLRFGALALERPTQICSPGQSESLRLGVDRSEGFLGDASNQDVGHICLLAWIVRGIT